MKFFAFLVLMTISFTSQAYYYHIPTAKVIDPNRFDYEKGTATYFDHAKSVRRTVLISDLSKATSKEINGVKSGINVLLQDSDYNFCQTFYLFENGIAYIGCQSDQIDENIGVDRPRTIIQFAHVSTLSGEIKEASGFKKFDRAILLKDANNLKAGKKVRIEAIFPNGEALIQKVGLNFLDTSGIRLKFDIERVNLNDLKK